MIIEKNKIIAPLTNFKIGGVSKYFVYLENLDDLNRFYEIKEKEKLPIFILGGGTNILFNKFEGFVIKPLFKNWEIVDEGIIKIGANLKIEEILNKLLELEYSGLEWAGGLPGELGGAIRGNAGCFGGEIKDLILEVNAFNLRTGSFKNFKKEDLNFNYRDSFFKKNKEWLIIEAILKFEKGNYDLIKNQIEEKINYRKERHPINYPNAGSIFKNIPFSSAPNKLKTLAIEKNKIKNDPFPVIPTAFVISELGLKGFQIGKAKISEKHANFIINLGGATFEDVIEIINYVKKKVEDEFEVKLEEEIEIVNY